MVHHCHYHYLQHPYANDAEDDADDDVDQLLRRHDQIHKYTNTACY